MQFDLSWKEIGIALLVVLVICIIMYFIINKNNKLRAEICELKQQLSAISAKYPNEPILKEEKENYEEPNFIPMED